MAQGFPSGLFSWRAQWDLSLSASLSILRVALIRVKQWRAWAGLLCDIQYTDVWSSHRPFQVQAPQAERPHYMSDMVVLIISMLNLSMVVLLAIRLQFQPDHIKFHSQRILQLFLEKTIYFWFKWGQQLSLHVHHTALLSSSNTWPASFSARELPDIQTKSNFAVVLKFLC